MLGNHTFAGFVINLSDLILSVFSKANPVPSVNLEFPLQQQNGLILDSLHIAEKKFMKLLLKALSIIIFHLRSHKAERIIIHNRFISFNEK